MKSIQLTLAALLCAVPLWAQDQNEVVGEVRAPEALIEALSLTAEQLGQLQANREAYRVEAQPLAEDIAAKQRELRQEVFAAAPNATVIGTITMEIEALSGRLADVREHRREVARGLLTEAQLTALVPIEAAAERAEAARQAVALILVPSAASVRSGVRRGPGGRNRPGTRN